MKKVLFASTALVMTAGMAAAEVTISGFAEIGIFGGTGVEDQFHTDIDATFTMSGTTDNGLTFGASIDLDESDGNPSAAFNNNTQGGESIFISGEFGTLTWGDTDGAFDWALQEVAIGGTINDSNTSHAGYSGNNGLDGEYYDGQIVRYEYVLGDLAFALSLEIDDTGVGDEAIGLGARYGTDLGGVRVNFGLGYQTVDTNAGVDVDIVGVSADARFANGFRAIVNYSDRDDMPDRINGTNVLVDSHWAIGLGYTLDAWTFAVNYGSFDTNLGDADGYALNVSYDLGGGAELQVGYSDEDTDFGTEEDRYDIGLALSF